MDKHDLFVKAWGLLAKDFHAEFLDEYPHPETLVKCNTPGLDHNVEVIYHTAGDVVLIQENGSDGRDRTAFVWTRHNPSWPQRAAEIVVSILSTI